MGTTENKRSILLALFGLAFALGGGLFAVLIFREFAEIAATYRWKRVPAEIQSLTVEFPRRAPRQSERKVFELKADYTYAVDGKAFRGDCVQRKPVTHHSFEKLADHKWRIVRQEISHVYMDPDNPRDAILERKSLWFGLAILFPLPFVAIGLSCLAGGLGYFSKVEKKKKPQYTNQATHGDKKKRGLVVLGAIFAAIGLGILYPLLIKPALRSRAAKHWDVVPCKVIWSRVGVNRGEDSDTYYPDVFYEYEFENDTYHSNRYSFASGSTSGRDGKRKIVRQYPAGKQTTCHVDPGKPWRAVIQPGIEQLGFWWLIPTAFAVVGVILLLAGLKPKHSSGEDFFHLDHDQANTFGGEPSDARRATILHRQGSRWTGLFGMILLAAFWNGVAGAIFGENMLRFLQGAGDVSIVMLIFSLPFFLIGLVIILGVFYAFGALFNPHVTLRLNPGKPRTGEEIVTDWVWKGGLTRVHRFCLTLEGVEKTTYTRGTNTVTDEAVFFRARMANVQASDEVQTGTASFEIPLAVMPTLDLIANDIVWRLTAEGHVRYWPNVLDTHEIKILPFRTHVKT